MKKFCFITDLHVGFENKQHQLNPLHDMKAIQAVNKFVSDFKPDVLICGGDALDCGPVGHWLRKKKASLQNLDLTTDAQLLQREFIDVHKSVKDKRYIIGNHEDWLKDAVEENPGLKQVLQLDNILNLKGWKLIPQGGYTKLGHLNFMHGDTLPNTKHVAAGAIERYSKPIVFGHFHTYQVATKYSPFDVDEATIAVAVPGLCNKNPNYLEGRPNQWLKGFMYGYVQTDGTFNQYVPIIINGSFTAQGRVYRG